MNALRIINVEYNASNETFYGELVDLSGELIISATLEYIFIAIRDRKYDVMKEMEMKK